MGRFSLPSMPDFTKMGESAVQVAASKTTTAVAAAQAIDALIAEIKMALLTHEAREQGLWSVATKQADSQSARMAKQSEVWAQI